MLNLKYLLVAVLLASLGMGSLAQAEEVDVVQLSLIHI